MIDYEYDSNRESDQNDPFNFLDLKDIEALGDSEFKSYLRLSCDFFLKDVEREVIPEKFCPKKLLGRAYKEKDNYLCLVPDETIEKKVVCVYIPDAIRVDKNKWFKKYYEEK